MISSCPFTVFLERCYMERLSSLIIALDMNDFRLLEISSQILCLHLLKFVKVTHRKLWLFLSNACNCFLLHWWWVCQRIKDSSRNTVSLEIGKDVFKYVRGSWQELISNMTNRAACQHLSLALSSLCDAPQKILREHQTTYLVAMPIYLATCDSHARYNNYFVPKAAYAYSNSAPKGFLYIFAF